MPRTHLSHTTQHNYPVISRILLRALIVKFQTTLLIKKYVILQLFLYIVTVFISSSAGDCFHFFSALDFHLYLGPATVTYILIITLLHLIISVFFLVFYLQNVSLSINTTNKYNRFKNYIFSIALIFTLFFLFKIFLNVICFIIIDRLFRFSPNNFIQKITAFLL